MERVHVVSGVGWFGGGGLWATHYVALCKSCAVGQVKQLGGGSQ